MYNDGSVCDCGSGVSSASGVRPAVYLSEIAIEENMYFNPIAKCLMVKYGNIDWIILDNHTGLCLSAYNLFVDKFDDKSNDYKNSYIKRMLKEISKTLGFKVGEV